MSYAKHDKIANSTYKILHYHKQARQTHVSIKYCMQEKCHAELFCACEKCVMPKAACCGLVNTTANSEPITDISHRPTR